MLYITKYVSGWKLLYITRFPKREKCCPRKEKKNVEMIGVNIGKKREAKREKVEMPAKCLCDEENFTS